MASLNYGNRVFLNVLRANLARAGYKLECMQYECRVRSEKRYEFTVIPNAAVATEPHLSRVVDVFISGSEWSGDRVATLTGRCIVIGMKPSCALQVDKDYRAETALNLKRIMRIFYASLQETARRLSGVRRDQMVPAG